MLWRLSRPTLGLAAASMVALLLGTSIFRLAVPGTATVAPISGVASILSGLAMLTMIVALIEFFLAARAFALWTAGKGKRCPGCDWPMSPSIVLPDRCINPRHSAGGTDAGRDG